MNEIQIQRQIVDCMRISGWVVYRVNNAGIYDAKKGIYRFSGTKGLPDLLAIRKDRLLFIECKRPGGKLRPEQKTFMDLIDGITIVRGITAHSLDEILTQIKR